VTPSEERMLDALVVLLERIRDDLCLRDTAHLRSAELKTIGPEAKVPYPNEAA
jgi:hypothetical protein